MNVACYIEFIWRVFHSSCSYTVNSEFYSYIKFNEKISLSNCFFLLLKYANFQQTLALMIVIMQIILYPIF